MKYLPTALLSLSILLLVSNFIYGEYINMQYENTMKFIAKHNCKLSSVSDSGYGFQCDNQLTYKAKYYDSSALLLATIHDAELDF